MGAKSMSSVLSAMLCKLLLFCRYCLDLCIDALFGLYYDSSIRLLPPLESQIVQLSARSLALKIRRREIGVEKVVSAYIERIKAVNGIINAVVDNRFCDALEEARRLDMAIRTGSITDEDFEQQPLLGVPFTTKESTACKGMSHTFGLESRRGRRATEDAHVVEQMKQAGAILLAVTNIPQLNMWQETGNPIFGLTCNPYNSTRNVGGSSGGESSLVAACGSPIGIGSDIGGSIRIPAFMCGVFGHKPTSGLINTRGLTLRTGNETETMVVAGPLCRFADDLVLIFRVLLGPERTLKLRLNEPLPNVKNLRIFYCSQPGDPFVSPSRPEMISIFQKVITYFRLMGCTPERFHLDGLRYSGRLWRYWMANEPNYDFARNLTDCNGRVQVLRELFPFIVGRSNYTGAAMLNMLNSLRPAEDGSWARKQTKILQQTLQETLGSDAILLYPSGPWPASYHHTALLRPWNFHYFAIWNVLKFPVTQIPLGLSKDGLPLGIQVVAAPHNDHLCLAVAQELERGFGGYVFPPSGH